MFAWQSIMSPLALLSLEALVRATRSSVLIVAVLALTSCKGGSGGGNDVAPPPPVSVTISPTTGSLEVGDSLQFTSEVNRDSYIVTWYVNDVQGGNMTVGTITGAGLYTAPASVGDPVTVTVKAIPEADTTKSDRVQITIYPKMAISPTTAVMPAGQTQQFTANKAASWFVNDVQNGNDNFGTIGSGGLFKAPASVPSPATVTIKAVWQVNSAKTATASVIITDPSSISISPTVVTVAASATQQFNASTSVVWQLSGAPGNDRSLGTINSLGLYTAPSAPPLSGKITVTAISQADPGQKAIAIVSITFSEASLKGHYAFRLWGETATNPYFVIGSFVADGTGGVSDAAFDVNDFSAPITNAPFKATYSIGADGRGRLNIVYGTNQIGWCLVMTGPDSGRLNAFGDGDSGWGSLERQDPASFSGGLSGPFAFGYDGVTPGKDFLAAAGMFTADGAGKLTNGLQDTNSDGAAAGNVMFTGSHSPADSTTGRGQLSIRIGVQSTNYVYYMLSAGTFIFSSTDIDRGLIGLALRQGGGPFSTASLTGDVVFEFSGGMPESAPTQAVAVGRFTADGKGGILSGTEDADVVGTAVEVPFTGTYTIDANGQGYASLVRTGATDHLRLYMISPRSAFFVSLDRFLTAGGRMRPQSDLPFSTSSISGTFGFGLRGNQPGSSTVYSGQLTLNGKAGTISGTADINQAGTPTEGIAVTGTYSISSNGRGLASLVLGTSPSTMGIYVVDPQTLVLIENDPAVPKKFGPAVKQF